MKLLAIATLSLASATAVYSQAPAAHNEFVLLTAETLEPALRCWVDTYRQSHPDFRSSCITARNAEVVQGLIQGKTPFAPCTQEWTSQELSSFTAKWGYPPTRIAVCMDALAVLVNRNNPIKYIRIEQVDAVYSTTRNQGWPKNINVWGELGLTDANWVNRPIQRYGHPDGSGTRAFFRESVELGGADRPDTHRGTDIMQMIETIMANQAAMGYGSFTQAYTQLKAIPLVPKGGKTPIEPTLTTIANGSYPLGRMLYLYVNKPTGRSLDPALRSFLAFILSREGQECIARSGFVPLPAEFVRMGVSRLGL